MIGIVSFSCLSLAGAEFVKGTFHQHATQPWRKCHYAAKDIYGGGYPGDSLHEQDDGGTDADALLESMVKSNRGYAFVGIAGNEELPIQPKRDHGLVVINVTENQMGAMCTKGAKHCKHPCDPSPPEGAGPWDTIDINNLHREYIQGVPGYFVQHPTTDPSRGEILSHMQHAGSLLRGLEVYNAWEEQAWDLEIPRDDADIDTLYPVYKSTKCTAWSMYKEQTGSCNSESKMKYWDTVLRSQKRPIYGLADDDGFDYTGDSDEPQHPHKKNDVQTDTPSWYRFGLAWSMVDVPPKFTAADVANAVDQGKFYGSTGIDLDYNISSDMISVDTPEPVKFAVAGGVGSRDDANPLQTLNITLCVDEARVITNVGCGTKPQPFPASNKLRLDLRQISGDFFYVRVQALVRSRYPIIETSNGNTNKWEFKLGATPNPVDVLEGRLLRATGDSRRALVVQSASGNTVQLVSHFSNGYGEISPDQTDVKGILAGTDQLVAERWAWMQPVFRQKTSSGDLVDPFGRPVIV